MHSDNAENKLQAFNETVITFERSPLPRRNLHHRILHKQANVVLGKFCLSSPPYDQGKGNNMREKNDSKPLVQHEAD